jgi:long-chain acyl-CoA synthetase
MSIISDRLEAVVGRFPDKPLFVHREDDGFKAISYRLFLETAWGIAQDLGRGGLQPGERVALLADYGPNWCAAYMGIHLAGMTVVPLDAQYSKGEIENIIGFVGPVAVFTDASHRSLIPGGNFRVADLSDVYGTFGVDTNFVPRALPEDAPMSVIFTSGTTGDPKGVMLSPENFMSNVDGLEQCPGLVSEKDVALAILPLHHVYGFTCTFLAPALIGCTVVFPRSIAGPDITEALKETGITLLVGVPQLLNLFHKKIFDAASAGSFARRSMFGLFRKVTRGCRKYLDVNPGRILFRPVHRNFPNLRHIASGGARLEPEVFHGLTDVGFSIVEAYGLTETSPIACLNNPKHPVAGSVGPAMAGVNIRIDAPEQGLDQGEVCIRGPNVMMGYFQREAETAKAVVDGWFHSGDLGYVDACGNIFLTGRKKEVIVLPNGKNIYPEELEKIYAASQRVGEVCVLPLGEKGKEKLAAAVHPNMEYFKRMKAGSIYQDIKYDIETVAGRLPSYQRVTRIEIIDQELPRTRLGKLKRFRIQEMIESREKSREQSHDDSGFEAQEAEDPFLRFIMTETGIGFVPRPDHNLETDVGLDSLAKLELFSAVEKSFGVRITPEQAGLIVTVEHLRAVVGDAAAGGFSDRFDLMTEMKRSPERPMKQAVDVGSGIIGGVLRLFAHFFLFLFLKIFMGAKIKGRRNLPGAGAFIIAGNHVSYFDALMVYGMFPYRVTRRMFSLSIPEIFGHFPLNLLRKPGRIIMTGTHDTMISSMQYSYTALKGGAPMCIFPEGKRSVDGRLDRPKPGVFQLAKECGAPLVPVYLKGMNNLFSRTRPGFRFTRLEAEILPPLALKDDPEEMMRDWFEALNDRLKTEGTEAQRHKGTEVKS